MIGVQVEFAFGIDQTECLIEEVFGEVTVRAGFWAMQKQRKEMEKIS